MIRSSIRVLSDTIKKFVMIFGEIYLLTMVITYQLIPFPLFEFYLQFLILTSSVMSPSLQSTPFTHFM